MEEIARELHYVAGRTISAALRALGGVPALDDQTLGRLSYRARSDRHRDSMIVRNATRRK